MAQEPNDNFFALAPKNLDAKYGPWLSLEAARAGILPQYRDLGQLVVISDGAKITGIYWWKEGTGDEQLIPFIQDAAQNAFLRTPEFKTEVIDGILTFRVNINEHSFSYVHNGATQFSTASAEYVQNEDFELPGAGLFRIVAIYFVPGNNQFYLTQGDASANPAYPILPGNILPLTFILLKDDGIETTQTVNQTEAESKLFQKQFNCSGFVSTRDAYPDASTINEIITFDINGLEISKNGGQDFVAAVAPIQFIPSDVVVWRWNYGTVAQQGLFILKGSKN
jgi:hypothetical protein